MFISSNPYIAIASEADIDDILSLLNSAYRGETSKQGWTTEAHQIDGETRTDTASLIQTMQQAGSIFLKYIQKNQIIGCVNLQ